MRQKQRKPLFVLFLGLLLLPHAGPAMSDDANIIAVLNDLPGLCNPVHAALRLSSSYLTYDPQKERDLPAGYQHEPGALNFSASDVRLGVGPDARNMPIENRWAENKGDNRRLRWNEFNDDDPETFSAFSDEGEYYDRSYTVYRHSAILYGNPHQPRYVYQFMPISRMSNRMLPEIFVKNDGSSLWRELKKLGASDLLLYGAYGYPVVRRPGRVTVYEINADKPGEPFEQLTFSMKPVCDFTLASTAPQEAQNAQAPPASAPRAVPAAPSAEPAAQPQADPCAAYAGSSQSYDYCQKVEAMKAAKRNRDRR